MNQNPPSTSQGLCPSLHSNSYFFLRITHISTFTLIAHISILTSVVSIVCCIGRVLCRCALFVANMPRVCTLCLMYYMHTWI